MCKYTRNDKKSSQALKILHGNSIAFGRKRKLFETELKMKSLDHIKHTAHTKSFYVSTTQYCSCVMQLPIWNNTILDSEKKSSPREQTEGKNRKNIKTVTMGNLKISSESRYSYEMKLKNTHTKDQFSFLNNFIRFLFFEYINLS